MWVVTCFVRDGAGLEDGAIAVAEGVSAARSASLQVCVNGQACDAALGALCC